MASPITQKITVDTKEGVQNVGELTKSLGEADSKGKQVAAALAATADKIEADLKGTATAADALGQALGPELAAKLGQNGIIDVVSDLKKLGLTSDDIVADVDQLADSIRRLDSAGQSLDGPKKGLRDVGDSATHAKTEIAGMRGESDNSRSVLANMVGNSTQDVANLGGVAGTAGLALGQMGEYAADGNIKLSGLAKVAGPLAAVTLVSYGINRSLGEIAATKAFDKKQVQDWATAIRDGKASIDDLATSANDAGKIDFRFLGDTKDLIPILSDAKMKASDWFEAVKGGEPAMRTFLQNSKDNGASSEDLLQIQLALIEAQKNYKGATEKAGEQQAVFGDTTKAAKADSDDLGASLLEQQQNLDLTREATQRAADWTDKQAKATQEASRKSDAFVQSLEAQRVKLNELYPKEYDAVTAKYDYAQQTEDTMIAVDNMNTTLKDHKAKQEDVKAATDAARDSILQQSEKFATLDGAALGSEGAIRRQIQSLKDQADSLEPGSPLRLYLEQYIADLAAIPSNVNTTMNLHVSSDATNANAPGYSPRNGGARAGGGPVAPGTAYKVGEDGEETLVMGGQGGSIIPNGGAGVQIGEVHVHVQNMPTPNELVLILAKYKQRNGGAFLSQLMS